jgi:hypothetical protein
MGIIKTERSFADDIRLWEDKREIKNLMGKYANLLILNRDDEIYDMLWSKSRADTAFGVNEGWYAGADSVKRRYLARYEKNRAIASMLGERLSSRFGGRRGDELYGVGVFRSMPVSCPIIKIASDGRTAKGLWVCQGSAADMYPYGPAARWIWGYYDVVFIREEDGWKIWRLKWLEELSARCGTDWGSPEETPGDLPEFAGIRDLTEPAPDREETLYTAWSPTRPLFYAKVPNDYATYTDEDSAAPQALRICDGEIVGIAPATASASASASTTASAPAPATAPALASAPATASAPEEVAELSEDDARKLTRVMDKDAVVELMNRRVHYVFAGKRREELDDLWVRGAEARARAAYGKNWGWYQGFDAIEGYYVKKFEARLDAQREANGAAERSVGNLYAHPVTTPYGEIAADGQSARGLWYSIAQETWATKGGAGADALWILEKIAVDFLKEEGEWRILNMMTAVDLSCGAGEDYSKQPVYMVPDDDPVRVEFGEPTVPALAHDNMFNWWDDYPSIPDPYQTFAWDDGYGPDGWGPPKLKGHSAGEGRNFK